MPRREQGRSHYSCRCRTAFHEFPLSSEYPIPTCRRRSTFWRARGILRPSGNRWVGRDLPFQLSSVRGNVINPRGTGLDPRLSAIRRQRDHARRFRGLVVIAAERDPALGIRKRQREDPRARAVVANRSFRHRPRLPRIRRMEYASTARPAGSEPDLVRTLHRQARITRGECAFLRPALPGSSAHAKTGRRSRSS